MTSPETSSLTLRGGHLIDPKNGIDEPRDILIENGRISEVRPVREVSIAGPIINVSGLYVTPGLVDIHTHLFATPALRDAWAGSMSVLPDGFSFRTGITTMVDAGSSGWRNFDLFRVSVVEQANTRVFALLNIAGFGMISDIVEQDARDFDPLKAAETAERHGDVIVGIKAAHYQLPDWSSMDRAVQAGSLTGLPVMVDFGYFRRERPYWQLVTEKLRPGDISTHCFRAPIPMVDERGKLYRYLYEARDRGVMFDVGHGQGSFVFRNAAPAVRQGFYPDSISSDLHTLSMNRAMIDLPTTMSKFLALGMPLNEVVMRSSWNPARMIHQKELGHLSPGAPADVACWKLLEGDFTLCDAAGGSISANRRLFCEMTLLGGKIVWDWNGRDSTDYRRLEPGYGIREGLDTLVPPAER